MKTTAPRPRLHPALLAAALVSSALALPGCYERVVDARGLGADSMDVQEPYQEDYRVDRILFGDDKKKKKSNSPLDR